MVGDAIADLKEREEGDALTQAAQLLEWGIQKLPELAELDVSDLLMAKVISDIQAKHTSVEHIFVQHLFRSILFSAANIFELKCCDSWPKMSAANVFERILGAEKLRE